MTQKEFILAPNEEHNGETSFSSLIWRKERKAWYATKLINGERVQMWLKTSYMHKVRKEEKGE